MLTICIPSYIYIYTHMHMMYWHILAKSFLLRPGAAAAAGLPPRVYDCIVSYYSIV